MFSFAPMESQEYGSFLNTVYKSCHIGLLFSLLGRLVIHLASSESSTTSVITDMEM